MSAAAVLKKDEQNNSAELVLSGEWLLEAHLDNRADIFGEFVDPQFAHVVLNGKEITRWDSQLVAFLVHVLSLCKKRKVTYTLADFPEGIESLLTLAFAVPEHAQAEQAAQKESFLIFWEMFLCVPGTQRGRLICSRVRHMRLLSVFC